MPPTLRDVRSDDLDTVLFLNESVVPAVNSLAPDDIAWFAEHAAYFRVAEDADGVVAFLIGLRPGTDYGSLNYRWFCEHYDDFAYVDRVAVAERGRRAGLASRLYDDFAERMSGEVDVMTCEVNIEPPNPGSMRFHERRGFRQVGSQATEGGTKVVALLECRL